MNLEDKCARFALLKELQEHHESMVKILGGELEKIGNELFTDFADSGKAESLRIVGSLFKDGAARIIKPVLKYKPSIVDQPLFFNWLIQHSHASLIKETVHPQTLISWTTKAIEERHELPDETMLKIFNVQTANVRRAPKS